MVVSCSERIFKPVSLTFFFVLQLSQELSGLVGLLFTAREGQTF